MRPAALQLNSYFVESLRFDAQQEFNSKSGTCQPLPDDLTWNLESASTPNDLRAYRLTLALTARDGRFPYAFEIVLVGVFDFDPNFPSEDAQKLADANAPAVLYGAAREIISSVTARGPFKALCLPSVTFNGLTREEKNGNLAKADTPALRSRAGTREKKTSKTKRTA